MALVKCREMRGADATGRKLYLCRCKRSRSPCASWCASSCHPWRQSSFRHPSSQREPFGREPSQQRASSRRHPLEAFWRWVVFGVRISKSKSVVGLKWLEAVDESDLIVGVWRGWLIDGKERKTREVGDERRWRDLIAPRMERW